MTDVSQLAQLAAAIDRKSPRVREYASEQARVSVEQEAALVPLTSGAHADELALLRDSVASIDRAVYGLADRVAKLEPAPPPPEPEPGKPFALFRFGSSFDAGDPALYGARYRFVIVGYGDNGRDVSPAGMLDYRTSVETSDNAAPGPSLAGVTHFDAAANGWALVNAAGGYVRGVQWGTHYGDVGSPAYQARFVATVRARLEAFGLAGLFLDNITAMRADFDALSTATAWRSDAEFQAAMLSHVKALRAGLPGYYLLANVGRAADRVDWWIQVADAGIDGLLVESYDGSDAHDELIRTAQSRGRDAWAIVYDEPTSPRARELAESFAAVTNGRGGFAVGTSGPDPWDDNWTKALAP